MFASVKRADVLAGCADAIPPQASSAARPAPALTAGFVMTAISAPGVVWKDVRPSLLTRPAIERNNLIHFGGARAVLAIPCFTITRHIGRVLRPPPSRLGSARMLKEGMAKAHIVTVLQRYAHDINRISALIPQGGGTTAQRAQSRLKQLKDAIHSDYKHRHAIVRSTQLTPLEQANLARTIRDVFFALQAIGVNTNPGREWRNALYGADMEIQRYVAELRGPSVEADGEDSDD